MALATKQEGQGCHKAQSSVGIIEQGRQTTVNQGLSFILQKADWMKICASFFKVRSLVLLEHGVWRKWKTTPGRREFGGPRYPFGRSSWKIIWDHVAFLFFVGVKRRQIQFGGYRHVKWQHLPALAPPSVARGRVFVLPFSWRLLGFRRSPVSWAGGWIVEFSKTQEWAHLT